MDPSPGSRYDAFCVKAEGKPCGDPPSFPHTVLHGHTGFEMGDELHYVCAQGYIMSNKDAAFTLLCHTCGEWFGQVQACVKDETEGHIDYEDNFPDDLSISTEEHEHNTKGPEEKEYEPQKSIEDGNKTPFDEDDNHIGMKTMYYEQESKVIYGGENFPIGPIIVNNATKTAKSTASNTDGSWLDGFPVTQEAVEEGDEEEVDKMDGSMAMEDDIHTGQINQFGIRNTKNTDRSNLEKDLVPQFTPTNGIIPVQVTLLPTSIPENVSLIRGSSEDIRYGPTPLMESVTQPLASVTSDTSLNLAILETSTDFHLIDQIPLPEEDGITFPMPAVTTLAPLDGFSDTSINFEGEAVTHRLGGKVFTTFEPCVGADCSSSDKGRMVAIGITVSCLVLLAVLLAVWCFKKQHQKNSVYKLNGKDYSRHQLQQIEMQKV